MNYSVVNHFNHGSNTPHQDVSFEIYTNPK